MKIMFIDDERRRMQVIVDELQDAGHTVVFADNVDAALVVLRQPAEHFDLVILDISMPSGKEYEFEDTDGGSRTGMSLYSTIRGLRPTQKIVVFTNVSDAHVREHFAKEDPRFCRLVRKPDVLPFQFVELVEKFVG